MGCNCMQVTSKEKQKPKKKCRLASDPSTQKIKKKVRFVEEDDIVDVGQISTCENEMDEEYFEENEGK